MALSTTGYTAAGAGITAANGNYVPVTGANATNQGAQQYFNGTNYLSFCTSPGGPLWQITTTLNANYNSAGASYSVTTSANTTNMPLTGWVISYVSIAAPAPTFSPIGGAAPASAPRLQPRVVVF